MGEIMRRPNELEMNRLKEQLSDPITFAVVSAFNEVMNKPLEIEINFLRRDYEQWKFITRRLLNHGKYVLLFTELDRINDEVIKKQWTDFKIPKEQPRRFTNKNYLKSLKQKGKITDIAKGYGLEVKGEKSICPFHLDTKPSLSFSNEKGVFHCFGCGAKGDILKFIQLIEELKSGNKRRS